MFNLTEQGVDLLEAMNQGNSKVILDLFIRNLYQPNNCFEMYRLFHIYADKTDYHSKANKKDIFYLCVCLLTLNFNRLSKDERWELYLLYGFDELPKILRKYPDYGYIAQNSDLLNSLSASCYNFRCLHTTHYLHTNLVPNKEKNMRLCKDLLRIKTYRRPYYVNLACCSMFSNLKYEDYSELYLDLRCCNLTEAKLLECKAVPGILFKNTNLCNVNFTGSFLRDIFDGCILDGANFSNCTFVGAAISLPKSLKNVPVFFGENLSQSGKNNILEKLVFFMQLLRKEDNNPSNECEIKIKQGICKATACLFLLSMALSEMPKTGYCENPHDISFFYEALRIIRNGRLPDKNTRERQILIEFIGFISYFQGFEEANIQLTDIPLYFLNQVEISTQTSAANKKTIKPTLHFNLAGNFIVEKYSDILNSLLQPNKLIFVSSMWHTIGLYLTLDAKLWLFDINNYKGPKQILYIDSYEIAYRLHPKEYNASGIKLDELAPNYKLLATLPGLSLPMAVEIYSLDPSCASYSNINKLNYLNGSQNCLPLGSRFSSSLYGAHNTNTGLAIAVKTGDAIATQYYLAQGANPQDPDIYGELPLWIAATRGYVEVVRVLLADRRTMPNIACKNSTPLGQAVILGYIEIARILLADLRTNPNMCTLGKTPLTIAAEKGNVELVRILLDAIRIAPLDNDDYSHPLCLARNNGNIAIAELLERHCDAIKKQP
jgi:hypothetical protein